MTKTTQTGRSTMRASDRQISFIKSLGKEQGYDVSDRGTGLEHVLSLTSVSHWGSLKTWEASKLIDRLVADSKKDTTTGEDSDGDDGSNLVGDGTTTEDYYIIHFRAGGLKDTVAATSEREALSIKFGIPEDKIKTRDDGRPVVRYGMGGVIFHEYVARKVEARLAAWG